VLSLRITSQTWQEVVAYLTAQLPREGAGALIQLGDIIRFVPLQNTASDEAHFRVDPAQWVSLLYQIELEGERLEAIVHSHPNSAPIPSKQDVQGFHYPDSSILIICFADIARPTAGLFKKNGQRFERCPLIID
jgi:proteasome lid subunit RPN8/RPN11